MGPGTTRLVSNAYVQYEAFIKHHESALGFIAAADGALYAMRRSLYHELPVAQVHDLYHPIQMALAGYRSVFVPEAYTVEPPSPDASNEYRRHVRIIAQGFLVFLKQVPRLVACRHMTACWMLMSHRFLRWISGAFLAIAFVSNAILTNLAPLYTLLFMAQLSFYALALGGLLGEHWQLRSRVLALPYYFCVVSLAGVGGFLSCLHGNWQSTWTPTGEVR
jgi:cellulose synthase/poly-beta-1,6-N-acetylglucosamine synthase-like glycosyltransferase